MESASCWERFRSSPLTTVLIVFMAMFLDGALVTTCVPIIPEIINEIRITNWDKLENSTENAIWNMRVNLTNLETFKTTESNATSNLSDDNFMVGVILAGKSVAQSIFNIFIGAMTAKFGYQRPMFFGFVMTIASTISFAFADTPVLMLISRSLQGVGTSFSTVSGLGLLATKFSDAVERGYYLGLAFTGFGLGVLIGPPFGSVLFQFCGMHVPFYILAGIGVVDGILQLVTLKCDNTQIDDEKTQTESTSLFTLLRDPYIIITATTMATANVCIAFLETGLPVWMIEAGSNKWMLGMPLLAMNVTFILTNNLAPFLAKHIGNWSVIGLGLLLSAISMIVLPFCRDSYLDGMFKLFGPCMILGIGCALVDVGVLSSMSILVETRHTPVYGTAFAISDMALCVAFAVGPLTGGAIIESLSFEWLMLICGILNLIIIPFVYFLRNPPTNTRPPIENACPQEIERLLDEDDAQLSGCYDSGRYGRIRKAPCS